MAQARDEAGNIWEVDAQGNPVRLIQAANTPRPVAPMNPSQQFEPVKAQADAQRAQAEAALATAQTPFASQLAQAEVQKALAEAEKARAEAGRDPAAAKPDQMKLAQFRALEDQIARVEQLYRQGPGSTQGISSVMDYLPSDANSAFNSAAAGLGEVGLAAFRVPGVGSQSDAELRQFVAANTPSAGDRDAAIREKLGNLRRRLNATQEQLGIAPSSSGAADAQDGPNALTALRFDGGPETTPTGRGDVGTQMTRNPNDIPTALNAEIDDLRARMLSEGGGRLDPQAYAQQVTALGQKYGFVPEDAAGFAQSLNEYLDAGGTIIPSGVIPGERLMTARETMGNNLVNNPLGAGIIGASNGFTAGAVEAFAPGQMMALRDAQPVATMGGEIAGAVGGTNILSRAAGGVAGRLAPALLQGGGRGQFARNIATDAAYGATYGQNTQGDPLTGAALGAGGSAAGQGVARGLGAGIGGLQRTAAAEALRGRGVPISVARQIGLGRVEDAMQSIPVVGDMSRARQLDSFTGFNESAMREAGQPIGFNPTQVGAAGVDDFSGAVSDAYTNATRGVTAQVDNQTFTDNAAVRQAIGGLPDDYRAAAETILDRRVTPTLASGQITGEQFQQAIRGIRQARSNAGRNPSLAGFEQEFREALTGVEDMLTGTMTRGAGPEVAANLGAANAANRGFKTIEDAALNRANVGTQAGEANIFTPAQLLQSARAAERKGFGNNPLMELGRQGQEVLPSTLPNSGTTDRAIMAGVLGTAGVGAGLGGAGGAFGGGMEGAGDGAQAGALTGGGFAALLAALGTRGGQRALEQVLITRPQMAQQVGQGFRRRGGLFGSAGGSVAQQTGY